MHALIRFNHASIPVHQYMFRGGFPPGCGSGRMLMTDVFPSEQVHIVEGNAEPQMGASFSKLLITTCRIHAVCVYASAPRAERGAWRAANRPIWAILGHHSLSESFMRALIEVPRLAILAQRPQVQGPEALYVKVAAVPGGKLHEIPGAVYFVDCDGLGVILSDDRGSVPSGDLCLDAKGL